MTPPDQTSDGPRKLGVRVHGRILDATTEMPIADALVSATPLVRVLREADPGAGERNLAPLLARTGTQGEFELLVDETYQVTSRHGSEKGAKTERVTVIAMAKGHRPFVRTFALGSLDRPLEMLLDPGEGLSVRGRAVEVGTRAPLDGLVLRVGFGLLGLEPTNMARGRLRGERELPRAHAGMGTLEVAVKTDAAGRFHISGLPTGFAFVRPEYGQSVGSRSVHAIPASEPDETLLELDRAARLTLEVRDARGAPAPGAAVAIRDAHGVQRVALADGSGRVVLYDLTGGAHRFALGLPRGAAEAARGLEAGRRAEGLPDHVLEVTVDAGETRTVVLQPPEPALGSLTCLLRRPSGAPAPGTEVWLAQVDSDDVHGWLARLESKTDAAGRVRFEQLPRGKYKVQAARDLHARAIRTVVVGPGEHTLEIELGEIDLGGGKHLRGLVRDQGGRPIPRARISAQQGSKQELSRSAETDERGAFVLGPLANEPVMLSIVAAGHVPSHTSIERPEDECVLVLEQGRTLVVRGNVRSSPRPVSNALASVWLKLGSCEHTLQRTLAGSSFSFAFPGLPRRLDAGTIVIRVGDHIPVCRSVPPDPAEIVLDDLILEEGAMLRGRIVDPRENVAKGGYGHVSVSGAWFAHVVGVDLVADGRFVLRGVPWEVVKVSALTFARDASDEDVQACEVQVDVRSLRDGDIGALELTPRRRP